MKKVCKLLLTIMAIIPMLSCTALLTDPAPSDGRANLTYDDVKISLILPSSARGRKRPSSWPQLIIFRNEIKDDHTVAASVLIGERASNGMTDQQYLEWWATQFKLELPKAPGRKGAVLRSVERIEGTRKKAPAEGAHCLEYIWVSEDRQVPGHRGEAFIMHAHEYVCIHPRAHVLVRSHFSERFHVERSELRPTFEQDVDFFFDNLVFY